MAKEGSAEATISVLRLKNWALFGQVIREGAAGQQAAELERGIVHCATGYGVEMAPRTIPVDMAAQVKNLSRRADDHRYWEVVQLIRRMTRENPL